MAAVAVNADNDRVAVATAATDAGTWGNDGGGGGVSDEPDFVYQGTSSQSRKVSTSRIGRQYSGGTTRDCTTATGTYQHFLFKINITNYAALLGRTTGPAAGIKIGSDASNYDEWYVYGNDNYPLAGGWQFVVINPNVSGYIDDATNGTPAYTAVDYYSLLADFSATSKGENVVIDAIDLGRGLKLTGGDGADADGDFADFLSADEGTSNNRWGYVRSLDGIYFVNGELAIGENTSESAVATVFQDVSGQVLVWENGMAATGYHRFRCNLGNATTDIDITGATFDSIGELNNTAERGYSTTEDTRLTFELTGTSGDFDLIDSVVKNCRLMTLTSVARLDGCDLDLADLTQSSAEIENSKIRVNTAANVALCDDASFGTTTGIHDCEIVQAGSGHAFSIDDTKVTASWKGGGTVVSGTGAVTPTWPTHATDDIGFLIVETTPVDAEPTLSTAAGFTLIGHQATSLGAPYETRLSIWWNRATSAAMSNPTVADPGDHVVAAIVVYQDCITTGSPWETVVWAVDNSPFTDPSLDFANTTTSFSGLSGTTGLRNVCFVADGTDRSSGNFTAQSFTGTTATVSEQYDQYGSAGGGGGLAVFDALVDHDETMTAVSLTRTSDLGRTAGAYMILKDNASEYTLTNVDFSGFGADASSSAAIDIPDTTGSYIFNVSGGTTPTIKTDGAAYKTLNSVDVTLNNVVVGSEILIYETADPANVIMARTAATATETASFNWISDLGITIRVRKSSADPLYLPYEATGTITNNGFSLNVAQQPDDIAVA